jgi:hypothetical protein
MLGVILEEDRLRLALKEAIHDLKVSERHGCSIAKGFIICAEQLGLYCNDLER